MHAVTFLTLTLPLSAPTLKDRPEDDPLIGRWADTSLVVDGRPDPQWRGGECEFRLGGRQVLYSDGAEVPGGPRTYKTDPRARPATIDLTEGDRTYLGIYKVEGDTLTLSIRHDRRGPRPTDFGPARGVMTRTFTRVKPKD
jgi:uncharacterized protein (TIGR03067 family)